MREFGVILAVQQKDESRYLATKRRYGGHSASHWRLTAVLRVRERLDNHQQAAEWYRAHGLPVPSNCMVKENPPIPYEQTVQDSPEETWDRDYRARAWRCPVFLVTEPLFRELREPPVVTVQMMEDAFGRIPGLLTPPAYPKARVRRLLELAGVAIAA